MSWNSGRLWSMALVPIPVAGLCVMCLVGQLGIDSSILAPVSFLAVCALAFTIALRGSTDRADGP
jgi:hypothetical protein